MGELQKWNRNRLRCFNCIFFEGKEDDLGFIQVGRCIRHAPTIRGFPIMYPNMTCGDHRLNENKILPDEDANMNIDYEVVKDEEEEYVEPTPYIRKDGILPKMEREEILNNLFDNKSDEEVVSEILGQEPKEDLEKKN